MDEWLQLLDDANAEERSRSRRRERQLRTVLEESATLRGALVDLAERQSVVRVSTTTGRAHVGVVRLVGSDFVVVGTPAGDLWVALAALASVRSVPGERAPAATGDRTGVDIQLVEAIGRVAPDRPRVGVITAGGELLAGVLRAAGADVVTIEMEGVGDPVAYVPSASIFEVFRSG